MILYLTGFMGCGKSTIGRAVSALTGIRLVDTDREIEKRAGMNVSEIFSLHGESRFRDMERSVLEEVAGSQEELVVSTGGGLPCHADNYDLMLAGGRTVYLKMSPGKLRQRLAQARVVRPKLAGMDEAGMLDYITRTLAEREPCYMRASMVVDCDGVIDKYITEHVIRYIEYLRTQQK